MDMQTEFRPHVQRSFKEPIKNMIGIMEEIMQKNPTSVAEFVGMHSSFFILVIERQFTSGTLHRVRSLLSFKTTRFTHCCLFFKLFNA